MKKQAYVPEGFRAGNVVVYVGVLLYKEGESGEYSHAMPVVSTELAPVDGETPIETAARFLKSQTDA